MKKELVKYQLPWSDGEKNRLVIEYQNKDKNQIIIKDGEDSIIVDARDIDWLREVFYDLNRIDKENRTIETT